MDDTLRHRVDAFLAEHGIELPGGTITALLQARVLGYVFNPISIYWCHDDQGVLRHVVAEVHNTYGGRHAYLLPPTGDTPAAVKKKLYVSPFNEVDGYYLVRAPLPDTKVDVTISLHRDNKPAFVATLHGDRRKAGTRQIIRLQLVAPLAPLMGAMWIRIQGITLFAAAGSRGTPGTRGGEGKGRPAVTTHTAGNLRSATDSDRWPAVARVPRGPLSAAAGGLAHGFLRRAVARLPIRLQYPDGSVIGAADPTLPTMVVHHPDALARRVGRYGLIGFGESYMAGEWHSNDLAGLLTAFANSVADLIPSALQRLRPLAVVRHPRSMYNSLDAGAQQHRRTLRPVQRPVRTSSSTRP